MCGGSQAFDGVPIPYNAWFSTRVSCHPMSVHLTLRMALRSQFKCLHFTREKVGPRESGGEKKKEKGKPSQGSTGAGARPQDGGSGSHPPPSSLAALSTPLCYGCQCTALRAPTVDFWHLERVGTRTSTQESPPCEAQGRPFMNHQARKGHQGLTGRTGGRTTEDALGSR